jgi:hypothetical protein
MTVVQTFNIPEHNISRFNERVEQLNRRAEKLGVEPIVVTFGTREPRSRPTKQGSTEHFWVLPTTVSLTTIKLNGWSFVAKLVHLGTPQVVVLNAPGEKAPEEFRTVAPTCDHCQVQRNRNETFVLRHESGTHKRVGRQCLKDFLGHESSEVLAGSAQYLLDASDLARDAEDDEWLGPSRTEAYPGVLDYMIIAATVIRLDGWVSSNNARDTGCESTASKSFFVCRTNNKDILHAYKPTSEDEQAARDALEWGKSLGEKQHLTDYEHNVFAALQPPCVHRTTLGIVASAVAMSQREKEQLRLAKHSRPTLDAHFGKVGERVTFQGYLERTQDVQSIMTMSVLHHLRTLDGHIISWFCTGKELEPSNELRTFTATVKGHRVFNGVKQTTVSRLVECIGQPKQKRERAPKKKAA